MTQENRNEASKGLKQPVAPAFVLETRSFIPFETLGIFAGDNRGFSEAPRASARIRTTVTLRPDTATFSDPDVWSDATKIHGIPRLKDREATSPSRMDPVEVTAIANGAQYRLHSFGPNPWVPGAPDIDVHTKISIAHPLPRVVNIEVTIEGDQFPAFEAVLRDHAGNALFLGGYMSDSPGKVATHLLGDTQRPMGKVNLQVTLDANNNFDRILSIKFSGPYTAIGKTVSNQTYTPSGWSRALMTALTPDHMPQPQIPERDSPPTLKQAAPQKSKQAAPEKSQKEKPIEKPSVTKGGMSGMGR